VLCGREVREQAIGIERAGVLANLLFFSLHAIFSTQRQATPATATSNYQR
jgi:hypothetical protein